MRRVNLPIPKQSLTNYLYNLVKPAFTMPDINNPSSIKLETDHYIIFKGYRLETKSLVKTTSASVKYETDDYYLTKDYKVNIETKEQFIRTKFYQIQQKDSNLVINKFFSEYISPYYQYLETMNIVSASPNYTNKDLSKLPLNVIEKYQQRMDTEFLINYKGTDKTKNNIYKYCCAYRSPSYIENEFLDLPVIQDLLKDF